MEWQNGRQLSRAATERDSTTEDVLDFAYDANGIRTSKTVTRNTYRPVQTYKVTFVADGKTVKTMNVTEGYTLKDSDYPAVPEKAGYTGAWQRYPSPVKSNVTVSTTYTKITTYYTVTFVADGETVKTISVYSGYKLKDSDYPRVPYKAGYEGSWQKRTAPVTSNVTINAVYTQILHTVSFRVMDEGIIHTMEVPDRYVLQEEDYPTIPKRVGYTSRWDTRVTMIVRDTIIDAIYSDGSTHEVTFLAYGNENLGTITVEDGYLLQEEDYPTIPERTGYRGSWPTQVDPIYEDTIIHAQYEEAIPVPTLPTDPGEIMSGGEGEPVEADEPEEGENDTTPAETERTISGVLASTETVTHEYLTQSGKVVRETITTSMDTTTLDFFYDESGRPFAFNYTPEGSTPNTYYYILNLQGDVVQIIDEGGVLQAEYVYSPWGEVSSAEGDLAEINPLRYRGYYYDSETGFYYLQSRYYDPENHRFINADTYASTDSSDAISCNVFAYCLNDPVNRSDSDGNKSLKDIAKSAIKGFVKHVVKPVNNWTAKQISKLDFTYSTGLGLSGSFGIWNMSGQLGLSIDSGGNVEMQYTVGGAVTTGSGVSLMNYQTITNAPNVTNLHDDGYQVGASVGVPIYNIPAAAGADINIIPDTDANRTYYGFTSGAGLGTPGMEAHVGWSTTRPVKSIKFNINEIFNSFYDKILGW